MADVIYLVCSTTGESSTSLNNSNKFHKFTKRPDGQWDHTWGRVGASGQTKVCSEAKKDAKVRESLKGGYTQIEVAADASGSTGVVVAKVDLRQKAIDEIAGGDKKLAELVGMLADKNTRDIVSTTTLKMDAATGLFKTDGGIVVTRKVLDEARSLLGQIKTAAKLPEGMRDKVACDYLMRIPTDIGRSRPTFDNVFPDPASVLKQEQILDSLLGSLDMLANPATSSEAKVESKAVWSVKLTPVDSKELSRIDKKFRDSFNASHAAAQAGLKPRRAWELRISSMDAAFAADGEALNPKMELWHGTRVGNVLSILSRGLIIPPWADAGRMYGDGCYFSDQSTKSLNYAYGYWGGGKTDNNCFMLLADVAVGKMYRPRGSYECSGWKKPPAGFDSVFAEAGKSGVMNNEFIAYRESQYRVSRLVEFGA